MRKTMRSHSCFLIKWIWSLSASDRTNRNLSVVTSFRHFSCLLHYSLRPVQVKQTIVLTYQFRQVISGLQEVKGPEQLTTETNSTDESFGLGQLFLPVGKQPAVTHYQTLFNRWTFLFKTSGTQLRADMCPDIFVFLYLIHSQEVAVNQNQAYIINTFILNHEMHFKLNDCVENILVVTIWFSCQIKHFWLYQTVHLAIFLPGCFITKCYQLLLNELIICNC